MEAFSIVAALATAVQAVALIMLHLLPTGYSPVRDAVSDYGIGPYRGWSWLQAVAGGLGCLALGIALAQPPRCKDKLDQQRGGNRARLHL